MKDRLSVGVLSGCVAPLRLDRFMVRLWRTVGVDSMFAPDHYCCFFPQSLWTPGVTPASRRAPSQHAFFDPFVMMGTMAAMCPGMRLGAAVTEPLRRHPASLAQALVTVDHLTRGGAILGIGNGERANTEPYGIPFTKRVARLEESLAIIRLLWESRGEPVDFDGSFWRLDKALFATPLRHGRAPAVWVAANAPRMLALTGRYGDGWLPNMKLTPEVYGSKLQTIQAAATAAGRKLERFEPAMMVGPILGASRAGVLAKIVRNPYYAAMAMMAPGAVWRAHGLRHPLGDDCEGVADLVPQAITAEHIAAAVREVTPDLLAEVFYTGSVDEIVADLRQLADAGARHLVVMNLDVGAIESPPAALLRMVMLVRRLRGIRIPPQSTSRP